MVYISAFTCIKSLIHTYRSGIGVVGGSLIRRFPMFGIGLVSVLYVWERELSSEYLQYWPLVQFWTPSSVTQCRRERVPLSPALRDRRGGPELDYIGPMMMTGEVVTLSGKSGTEFKIFTLPSHSTCCLNLPQPQSHPRENLWVCLW